MKRYLWASMVIGVLCVGGWWLSRDHTTEPIEQVQKTTPLPTPLPKPSKTPTPISLDTPTSQPLLGPSIYITNINKQGIGAKLLVGGAGRYPAVEVTIDPDGKGHLPKQDDVVTLGGQDVDTLEIYARGTSQAVAFWGDARPSTAPELEGEEIEYQLTLKPAAPMRFQVMDAQGQSVAGARVVLAQRALHVMHLHTTTDAQGFARFDAIPNGTYHATVYAPGFLRHDMALLAHDIQPDQLVEPLHRAVVSPTREIYGCVKDVSGQGAANALIFAHVVAPQHPSYDRALHTHEVIRVDGPPVEGVAQADLNGCFSISGLSAGRIYLEARTPQNQPTISPAYDLTQTTELGPIEFQMERGHDVVVTVVDAERRIVPGATVTWVDELTGLSGAEVTNEQGIVIFSGMPQSATVQARLKSWTSPQHMLGVPDEQGDYAVEVMLNAASKLRRWTMRLNESRDVDAISAYVLMDIKGKQVRCEGVSLNARDWQFDACPVGDGWLHVQTVSHGTWRLSSTFGQDVELTMPAPSMLALTINGPTQWANAQFFWRGAEDSTWNDGTLTGLSSKQDVRWTHALYPGSYDIKLNLATKSHTRQLVVTAKSTHKWGWTIVPEQRLLTNVVDVRGVPVTGALLQLIDGRGRIIASTTSKGHTPSQLSFKPANNLTLLAMSPSQGEGRLVLTQKVIQDLKSSRNAQRIVLNSDVLTIKIPGRITDLKHLEQRLGVQIVQDGDALLLDVTRRDSLAYKAGIPRGARLLSAVGTTKKIKVWYEINRVMNAKTIKISP